MRPIVTVLVTLVLTSAMIALILAIAWRDFGRPRHAFTWAVAYTMVSVGWALQMVGALVGPVHDILATIAIGLNSCAGAAIAIGFRQRAGLPTRARPLVALAALVAFAYALLGGMHVLPGLRAAIPSLFSTFAIGLAAATLTGRRAGERAAERATRIVLIILATFHFATAAIALLADGGNTSFYLQLYAASRLLVMPAALIGTGLFTLFLLAADLADRMRRLAASDPLTGILNRRGFEEAAALLLASARRQGRPVSLVLADIDRFKAINDGHGHAAGDRALQYFAEQVGAAIRRRDLFGRIGGEEFAIMLPDTPAPAAMAAIEALRAGVANTRLDGIGGLQITASFGITEFRPDVDADLSAMMGRADRALYRSKMDGRDRATLSD